MTEGTSLWKCPRCGMILEKTEEAAKFFQERAAAGRSITGTVTCSSCTAIFPIEDIYSGRYDTTGEDE